MFKKMTLMVMLFALSVFIIPNFAVDQFSDVPGTHWASNAINVMLEQGIFSGYPDGTFKPENQVTRAEFSKVMVLALGLKTQEGSSASYVDLPKTHWAFPYVEGAKAYLTGYQTAQGIAFRPDEPAQREDMAVALVKALKLPISSESVLRGYADVLSISPALRPYVATAIENGLMVGFEREGNKYFGPLEALTRAQTSQLLVNVLVRSEKILLGEDKIVLDPKLGLPAVARVVPDGNHVWIKWDSNVSASDLKYFKVVASLKDSRPSYPKNGYATYMADVNQRAFKMTAGTPYSGGDFQTFEAGKTYYMAITTVYKDGSSVTSEPVMVTIPKGTSDSSSRKPAVLKLHQENDGIKLLWQSDVSGSDLQYFKVVASATNPSPKYPDDGYAAYFSSTSDTYMRIKPGMSYQSGSFSKFQSGVTYYFTVTTVYKDGTKLTSNVVSAKLP